MKISVNTELIDCEMRVMGDDANDGDDDSSQKTAV